MILAIDQGTTGTTCLVVDDRGVPVGRAARELRQYFPRAGWVEHDATEIWESVLETASGAITAAGITPADLSAIGITNQRETVVAWDRASGEPLHRAIVWQDRRTAPRCADLREAGYEGLVRERTGLTIDPYFSATKIEWILSNVEGARERACFGTVDSWLAFKLTGRHVTDYGNAARTMLFDIARLDWDGELCALFDVPVEALPLPRPSSEIYGQTERSLFGAEVPVAGIAGDQQAALFGQACLTPGLGKNTYGTGSFVLLNAGHRPPAPVPGLISTVAWGIADRVDYALEASVFVSGAAVQWLRDGPRVIADAGETEALAGSIGSNAGVYFVPALTGLGSPHWDAEARGTIFGLTRGTGRAELARATLEAIAYQTVDAVEAMAGAAGSDGQGFTALHVDGGAVANNWLMQFQADVLGAPVVVPEVTETTALGAALLAGVAVGVWDLGDVGRVWRERRRFEPSISDARRAELLVEWRACVSCARQRGRPRE